MGELQLQWQAKQKHAKTSIVKWAKLLISNRFLGDIGLKNAAERDLVHVNGSSVPVQIQMHTIRKVSTAEALE